MVRPKEKLMHEEHSTKSHLPPPQFLPIMRVFIVIHCTIPYRLYRCRLRKLFS
jgi:hypothetical protein